MPPFVDINDVEEREKNRKKFNFFWFDLSYKILEKKIKCNKII